MPGDFAEIKATPQHIVFISGGRHIRWPASNPRNLHAFVADCRHLGFAIWITSAAVFVFTGEGTA